MAYIVKCIVLSENAKVLPCIYDGTGLLIFVYLFYFILFFCGEGGV